MAFQAKNPLVVEATALWEGYKFAEEWGHNMVCFESDSQELIKSVCGSFGRGSWTLYPILTLIRDEQRLIRQTENLPKAFLDNYKVNN
ncbi:hypothetical protein GBA52_004525 [Prunus armeniaca]|nr:hypothetical protein GBA52_004525 [Prunus armeniaca]